MSIALLLAWVLPWAAGTALFCLLSTPRVAGWVPAALGHGLVLGMLLAAAAADVFARADTEHALWRGALPLAVFALVCGAFAWRRTLRVAAVARPAGPRAEKKWKVALCIAALAALALRAVYAAREIQLRPTFPWDAWDAWAVKSKTWYLLGHYVPYESMLDWFRSAGDAHSGVGWSYPTALPWLQVWFASAVGGWIEPVANLPWLVLWIGLLLLHYGQWRALGLDRVRAIGFVYVLGSLPLVTVHVALAGYADLWLGALLGAALLAWQRWRERQDRGQLLLAVACAVLLPWIKLEGAVWLLLFAGWAAYHALPPQRRRWIFAALLLLALAAAAFGCLALPLFGLGWVDIELTRITVPYIGMLNVGWHGSALGGVFASLFAQPNWHLLWWLVPTLVALRWRALNRQPALRALGGFLLLGFGFLLFLFLFTDAARWAESYTAVNRLVMHLVPATVTLLALLCRQLPVRRRHRVPPSAVQPARA